jgi:CHASE3 domain sensor protein
MLQKVVDESVSAQHDIIAPNADRVSQRREKERNTMSMIVEQRRGSIRENRAFWLLALVVLAIGVLAIAIAWATAGTTAAATIMLLELGAALAAGFR